LKRNFYLSAGAKPKPNLHKTQKTTRIITAAADSGRLACSCVHGYFLHIFFFRVFPNDSTSPGHPDIISLSIAS
jgi:hypothetical protein